MHFVLKLRWFEFEIWIAYEASTAYDASNSQNKAIEKENKKHLLPWGQVLSPINHKLRITGFDAFCVEVKMVWVSNLECVWGVECVWCVVLVCAQHWNFFKVFGIVLHTRLIVKFWDIFKSCSLFFEVSRIALVPPVELWTQHWKFF